VMLGFGKETRQFEEGFWGSGNVFQTPSEVTLEFDCFLNGCDDHKAKNPKRVGDLERDRSGSRRLRPWSGFRLVEKSTGITTRGYGR
jgi:hypothetical protein